MKNLKELAIIVSAVLSASICCQAENFTVDKALAVGEIPIISGYSQSGAKTYTVPLNIPSGAQYPYMNLYEGMMLLSSAKTYLDDDLIESTSYHYYNPVFHRQGLGFVGFERVFSTDMRGRTCERVFDPYKRGVPVSEKSPVSEAEFAYDMIVGSDKLLRLNRTSEKIRDLLRGAETSTASTFDSYGNVLTAKTTYSDGNSVTKTFRYDNNATPSEGYHIGYHVDDTETVSYNGDTYVSRIHIPSQTRGSPLKRITYSNGVAVSTEEFEYDPRGLVLQSSTKPYASPHTHASTFTYDSLGRILTKTDPLGRTCSYVYNALGQLDRETDFRGQYVSFDYDEFGRESRRVLPEAGPVYTSFTWSASDEPGLYRRSVARLNRHTEYTYYDAFNREVASASTRFDGKLAFVQKTYDRYGRLSAESLPYLKGSSPTLWTEYAYDSYDRPVKVTSPSGASVTHTYNGLSETVEEDMVATTTVSDAMGRILKVTDPSGTVQYTLRADGQPSKITAPEGAVTLFAYDTAGRLASRTDPSHGTSAFTYDSGGNIATETDARGLTTSYAYDRHDRVVRIETPEMTVTDTFDPTTGDLIGRESSNGFTRTSAYDRLGRISSETETYDGRSVKKEYSYYLGELSKIATTSDTSLPTRDQNVAYSSFARPLTLSENYNDVTFDYGPDFNRVKMQRDNKSAWNMKRFYLGGNYEFDAVSNMPAAVKDDPVPADPFLPETYGTNGGITIAPEIGGEVAKQELFYDVERIYLGGDAYTAPAVLVKSTSGKGSQTLYYIVRDHLGSIAALVDTDGKTVQESSYDPWGRLRDPGTHEVYAPGKEPKLILGRGYGGHEHLPDFGLINMNARLYDPVLGRFLSPDPYVQDPRMPQNFNRYSYCLNNPLCYVDPDGEIFFVPIIVGALVGGMANLAVKSLSGDIHSFGDGLAAFGIGAVAGGVGVLTGGIAPGLIGGAVAGGGLITGVVGGAVIGATGALLESAGNSMYFGDKFISAKNFAVTVATASVIGGVASGITAVNNGQNFFKGSPVQRPGGTLINQNEYREIFVYLRKLSCAI